MKKWTFTLLLSASPWMTLQWATAQEDGSNWMNAFAPEWNISGDVRLKAENYTYSGSATGSPYSSVGNQIYGEIDGHFWRRFSPHEIMRGFILAADNHSRYRGDESGLLLERGGLQWEKGDAPVPFRLDAGDHFLALSPRTLQAPLKGGRLELQPRLSGSAGRHSFVVFSGIESPYYHNLSHKDPTFTGLSWLMDHSSLGAWNINLVRHHQSEDVTSTITSRESTVVSLAGEKRFAMPGQSITLEGELAHYDGRYSLDGIQATSDQADSAIFLQASGNVGAPFTWSSLYERYGEHFVSEGGLVPANRETMELRSGWRTDSGLRLSGRLQQFEDQLEGSNPIKTRVVGGMISGPFFQEGLIGLFGSLNAFVQTSQSADQSIDTLSQSISLDLSKPIGEGWNGRMGLSRFATEDQTNSQLTITRQLTLGVDRALSWNGIHGSIIPGIALRDISGATSASDEIQPTLAILLAKESHSLHLNYGHLRQDRRFAGGVDQIDDSFSWNYTYLDGPHEFGFDGDYLDHAPFPGAGTQAYRFGISYTYRFDRPAQVVTGDLSPYPFASPESESFILAKLTPGLPLQETQALLQESGLTNGIELGGGTTLYESRLIPWLDQRQRLVVLKQDEQLTHTALLIDLDNTGGPDSMERTYSKIREHIMRRLGPPTITNDLGRFGPNMRAELFAGTFARLAQWPVKGGVLRLGIPRRLDGQVRIEIQTASSFPSPRQANWGLERVP
ncbi:MAG: hypothetical protein G8345_14095 [Magnetococcales bacterium]|nr:hypothetical protein [Magnetococcales bacterium]NGZ28008.1 hypothetical protein [Magnetococcales bacterium]